MKRNALVLCSVLCGFILAAGIPFASAQEETEEYAADTALDEESALAEEPEAAAEPAPAAEPEPAATPETVSPPVVEQPKPPAAKAEIKKPTELVLFTEIPVAVITKTLKNYTPASITLITAEQIRLTPARNLYDLIEIYVPGAFWVNHHESPHFGVRGIISDRNYKFLLLVNGRRVNQDAHSGAELLLENWDLNDIQKIEIVRGPGSVTYGPGAIEAVINITTKNASTSPDTNAGVQYNYPYDSKGIHISQGFSEENWNCYAYGSIVRTSGIIPDQFYVNTNNQAGYLGEDPDFINNRSLYYFNDADALPQVKFNLDVNILNEWNLYTHYSNFGTSRILGPQTLLPNGDQVNYKENKDQGMLAMLRNKREITDSLELKSALSFSSLDHQRRAYSVSGGGDRNVNNIRNLNHKFAESELLGSVIGNYSLTEQYQIALGMEYSQKWFGPGWNGNDSNFRMGDSSNIFGSQEAADEAGITGPYFLAENGWQANKYSVVTEFNLAFDPKLNLIVSGRMDDHEYADANYSPRVCLISDWDTIGIFKLIGQQSVRMNTEEQMLLAHLTGAPIALETLKGWEFIHKIAPLGGMEINTAVYYNTLEIVGWRTVSITNPDFSFGDSTLLGTLRLWGVDLEGKYTWENLTVGLSQTYCKQLDFTLAEGQRSSGISYADYNYPVGGGVLSDTGNDINNWANISTKFFTDYKIAPQHTVHMNVRVLWGMEGPQDGLEMLEKAAEGTSSEAALDNAIKEVRDKNAYKMDLRLDASYRYDLTESLGIILYGMNLLNVNGNKRYAYDAGIVRLAPYRTNWVEEPLSVGVKVDYSF
ncbi:TonB-dependent receptor plug domain-containing protein [candidate division FCPU426 bacterium]|nr:TonB-dependent receptor plug domain-containing protein [candidate division FCPU426 bacterium]